MGSAASKPSRSLARSNVAGTTKAQLNRTNDVNQLHKIKDKLNQHQLQLLENDSVGQGIHYNQSYNDKDANKTLSDFISKRLGDFNVKKEELQLSPNHSSLRRLSNKKKLEEDYKNLIDKLETNPTETKKVIDTNMFKEILLSLQQNNDPQNILQTYNISSLMLQKISDLSQVISIPTEKVKITQRRSPPAPKLSDQSLSEAQKHHKSVENELNEAFSSILQGSQTGYDIQNHSDGVIRNQRTAHSRLPKEVRRTFDV